MTGEGKPTGRVISLVALVVVSVVALRGYFPGSQHTPTQQPIGSVSVFVSVVALLGVSLAVVAIAVITRVRNRRVVVASPAGRSDWLRSGSSGRSSRRALLVGLGLIAACLVVVFLLALLVVRLGIDHPLPGAGPHIATPGGGIAPPAPHPPAESGPSLLGYLYATTMLFVLVLAGGSIVVFRKTRRAAEPSRVARVDFEPSAAEARSESLTRAATLGLAAVGDLSREPRHAIIACYVAMERELGNVPDAIPQDFDTASEVLARAVEHHALQTDSAVPLVDLFAEARFSPHVMNEGHRDSAMRALQLVLAELRSVA